METEQEGKTVGLYNRKLSYGAIKKVSHYLWPEDMKNLCLSSRKFRYLQSQIEKEIIITEKIMKEIWQMDGVFGSKTDINIQEEMRNLYKKYNDQYMKEKEIERTTCQTELKSMEFMKDDSLKSYTVPYNVTKISNGCFYKCTNLTELIIPENVEEIENGILINCTSLKKVTFPAKWCLVGDRMMTTENRELRSVILPDSVKYVNDEKVYSIDQIQNFRIPSTITKIASKCFSNCNFMTEVSGLREDIQIDRGAFLRCHYIRDIMKDSISESIVQQRILTESQIQQIVKGGKIKRITSNVLFDYRVDDCSVGMSRFNEYMSRPVGFIAIVKFKNGLIYGFGDYQESTPLKTLDPNGCIISRIPDGYMFETSVKNPRVKIIRPKKTIDICYYGEQRPGLMCINNKVLIGKKGYQSGRHINPKYKFTLDKEVSPEDKEGTTFKVSKVEDFIVFETRY